MDTFNQQQRKDLAAAYRLVALFGWDDLSSTHISARMEEEEQFLLNSRDQFFDEITASSLIEVDSTGHAINTTHAVVNKAGFVIHSAIHQARPDVGCVIHTHTQAGMAVSAMECGLLPISQHALRFYNAIGLHDYEGIAVDLDERSRLVADLGDGEAMILRNHGLLAVGKTVAEAFSAMYYLEKACRAQIDAMQSHSKLHYPDEVVCQYVYDQYQSYSDYMQYDWNGLIRKLDRLQPDYKN
jgi:ribulose-5-phosphate 4-epimerase/fuculose-1-phosphate aldolase|tara:strand:- start:268 stop:990 length:723 start_codon:yes stop_codon:yes gene_type:complete